MSPRAQVPSGGDKAPSALLDGWDDRLPWKHAAGTITATEILRGSDATDLVVVSATASSQPTKGDLQTLWRARSRHAELEQQRLAGLRGGIPSDRFPAGVTAGAAYRAAELASLPKRQSLLDHALTNTGQVEIHSIRSEPEGEEW